MSTIKGTNVSSPIVPYTSDDIFPTHYAKYGNGGFMSVRTLNDLNNIPQNRREPGMFVYVFEDDKLHKLENDNTWVIFPTNEGGGGGISAADFINIVTIKFNGSTTYTITHQLGTDDVVVQILDKNNSNKTYTSCEVTRFTDIDNLHKVSIYFPTPPTAFSFIVVIIGHPNARVLTDNDISYS